MIFIFELSFWLLLTPPPITVAITFMDMSIPYTIKDSNGELLTGRLWRKSHPFFHRLPFYSDILRMDDIARPLEESLAGRAMVGSFGTLLVVRTLTVTCSNEINISRQKLARGLDEIHPFSDTPAVEVILREAEQIISLDGDGAVVGRNNASRIWAFMSKFAMLDRFSETLNLADQYPGIGMPRKMCSIQYFGTCLKVSAFLENSLTLLRQILVFRRD